MTRKTTPSGSLRRASFGLILAAVSASAATWTGLGPDDLASTAANWDAAPTNGAAIVLDSTSAKNMTWDLAVSPGSWMQTTAYTGTVTIATRYGSVGLTNLVISGDCTVAGGLWTHLANPAGEVMVYRLRVSVGGNFTLGAAAGIDVDARGFDIKNGPGKFVNSSGASHGGRGGVYGLTHVPSPCYGSLTRPYHLGSGGAGGVYQNLVYGIAGGGAVWLEVGGTLTLNGEIRACSPGGYDCYTGSGGSVCGIAGAIQGTGTVRANGGVVTKNGAGGGGRIALVVTHAGADFASWSGTLEALGCMIGNASSPGTIYLERANDEPGKGELLVRGQNKAPPKYTFGTEIGADLPQTNAFSRLTLKNSGVRLVVHAGSLLDLSQCQIDGAADGVNEIAIVGGGMLKLSDNPVWSNATLRLDASTSMILQDGNTLTIGTNGTIRIDQPWCYTGNLVVTNGGRLSHTAIGTVEQYALDLTVNGDLIIAPDGAVSATGCGYTAGYGPGKGVSKKGASHGGHGAGNVITDLGHGAYGSIYTPTNAGSGGSHPSKGGGIVCLHVSGRVRNDGVVAADGADLDYYTGSGGSLWVTAGTLAGSGVFRANGGAVSGYTPGAGGRIAITVTNSGATVAAFQGGIEAAGGALGSSNRDRIAGAGTVYLRDAAQALHEGTLIVDNNGMASVTRWTPIIPEVAGRDFGAVVLRDGGTLRLASGETITVSRGWSNENASLLAEADSTVTLAGGGPVVIAGTSTFDRLVCEVPGMDITFAADSLTRIASNGLFHVAGSAASPVTLYPAAAAAIWGLGVDSNALQEVEHVAVSNSHATAGALVVAKNSYDLGGNQNWRFTRIVPGEVIQWSGASDTQWSNAGNWDLGRAPVESDDVRVPAGTANQPALKTATTLNRLEIAAGASLALDGNDLTITNDLLIAGALTATATETVTLLGDASFAGADVTPARSRLLIVGERSCVIDFGAADFALIDIRQSAGTLTVNGGLAADQWQMAQPSGAALDCAFAAGQTVRVRRFIVLGDAATTNVTVRSTVPGSAWQLHATEYARVTGASVGDSDAAAGMTVPAFAAADDGGNANWDFAAKIGIWTAGGTPGDFHDPMNWAAGVVPGSDTHVVLDSAAVMITAPVTLRSLTVGGGGFDVACTSDAPLTVTESILLLDHGTLTLNKPVSVGNAFFIGTGALLTHAGNADTEANKLDIAVGGDMVIEQGGVIDVRRKGYGKKMGPGAMTINGYAPSYGGKGKNNNANEGQLCYGLIVSPTNLSSGSYHDVGSGAVRLTVDGTMAHYGEITADGLGGYQGVTLPEHYSGAGGSIWITAGNLLGDGTIHANGGDYLIDNPGGGGRIALVLTQAADFADFTGVVEARGGKNVSSQTEQVPASGAGTVFRRTANERVDMGTVTVDNDGGLYPTIACTDIPSASHGDPAEFRRLTFAITDGATLRLRDDCTVGDVQILDATGRLNLNGYSLTIHSKEHSFPAKTVINYGEIIWAPIPTGTVLTLR